MPRKDKQESGYATIALMEVKQVKLTELKPNPKNPRRISVHDFEALKKSLVEFGWVQPVIVNTRTGYVVGGHQRLKAAEALGMSEAPTVYVDLTESQETALNLGLNRISGDWDSQNLIELLEGLDESMRDLTGFDPGELNRLLEDPFTSEVDEPSPKVTEARYTIGQLKTLARTIYPTQTDIILDFLDVVERDNGEA